MLTGGHNKLTGGLDMLTGTVSILNSSAKEDTCGTTTCRT